MILRWLPSFIWMAVIFYLSHQPASSLDSMLPFFHKWLPGMKSFDWGHYVSYFILALTYYWGLGPKFHHIKGKLLVVALCVMYGITDEIHQHFIEGRQPDLLDIRNDGLGALLAMLFISIPQVHKLYMKFLRSVESLL